LKRVEPQDAFDKYHRAVFSFAYRMTRRADTAEDITQECFLTLVRYPQRFDAARGTVKTYLFAIARNLVLKNYRDTRGEGALEDDGPALSADPRRALEISFAVERAIAALPALQQEALILFEYEGVSLEEIAQITGADTGTIKSRLHRARERLRRELAPFRVRGIHGTV
jgi:RNA polymerase sigma-70 factor (ECF subfamily)